MKKIILFLAISAIIMPCIINSANASIISDRAYRIEQNKNYKADSKKIRELFKLHTAYSNKHDLKSLDNLYSQNFISNDGFNKETYFRSIEETWKECNDITYSTKITKITIDGDYASVNVEENATGTIMDVLENEPIAGEIHSKSTGIYYLTRTNGKWLISGENDLSDESSLLYGDARFMKIEIQAPNQVSAGETYTATVKVDADENTFIIGSIDSDPMTFPSGSPSGKLRTIPKNQTLERLINANNKNLNEYVIASLAISKVRESINTNYKVYMAGLACIMKRVNVVPKNNFIKLEDKKVEDINM